MVEDPNTISSETLEILTQLFDRSAEQLEILIRFLSNRDTIGTAVIESTALEFITKALKLASDSLQKQDYFREGGQNQKLAKALKRYSDQYIFAAKRCMKVNYHFTEISKGWVCSNCGNAVPVRAVIHGLRRPPLRVLLKCKACEKDTPITESGYTEFLRLFNELMEGSWNPRANGFLWEGD